ncbi:IS256 family transposase [Streptomyces avermitilis]|nr:IS256 family transposase [Streptomyces avermitilis]
MLLDRARNEGLQLTGQGGLLQQLTKRVLESAVAGEIADHGGYEKHDPAGKNNGNSRKYTQTETVLTEVEPAEVKVPRGTPGSFKLQIVKKRQRRLTGVDEMVLSLSAKGLTHGEISAHCAEVSKQPISTITDAVLEGMSEWQNRPPDRVYPVLFVDAINVKIRDGKVANRPIHAVMAVPVAGARDILGIRAGNGGEGARYWLHVFTEVKNRGLDDVLMLACDGLKGPPEAVETVFRYAARQDWDKVAKALRPVYTAPSEDEATKRLLEFQESWGRKHPAIVKLWSGAWAEFVLEIRKVICSTNAIESVNARIRKAVRARGHFPNEAAALKCVYMALMSLDPTGKGRKRWTMRWKAPLNAFQIALEARLTPSSN